MKAPALACCALMLAATPAFAHQIAIEAGSAVIRAEAPSYSAAVKWNAGRNIGVDHLSFYYECAATVITGSRGNRFGQCMIVGLFRYIDLGLGLALMDHADEFMPSRVSFALLMRAKLGNRWFLAYNHISNGNTRYPNIGRDMVRVGVLIGTRE